MCWVVWENQNSCDQKQYFQQYFWLSLAQLSPSLSIILAQASALQEPPFRWSTDNDIIGNFFCHDFLEFLGARRALKFQYPICYVPNFDHNFRQVTVTIGTTVQVTYIQEHWPGNIYPKNQQTQQTFFDQNLLKQLFKTQSNNVSSFLSQRFSKLNTLLARNFLDQKVFFLLIIFC